MKVTLQESIMAELNKTTTKCHYDNSIHSSYQVQYIYCPGMSVNKINKSPP